MKASNWLLHLLKPRLLHLMIVVLTVLTAAPENSHRRKYEGVVGGNMTFDCPIDYPEKLQFLYFQKEKIFVNGYFRTKTVPPTWPNTRVDDNETAVHMYGLDISHTGEYEWVYMYFGSTDPIKEKLHLSVTAPFSKPLITKRCENNDGCDVTCESHNGYPYQQITWITEFVDSQVWKEPKTQFLTNPTTKLLNISSTGYINCSSGEVNVSCSVGNIVSDVIPVCARSPDSRNYLVIIASSIILLIIVVIVVFGIIKFKTRQIARRRVPTDDHPLEDVSLAGITGVKEAP